jgi:2,4-dienoyl-CoA reductase-like NADH-dependent reductase (Old Yellow Enzyme family)/thioredoxin reductase
VTVQDSAIEPVPTNAQRGEAPVALGDPLRIGPVQAPNRIFLPPHGTNYADVTGSQKLADYYGGRARRGVGLIIHEAVAVHPSGVPRKGKVHAWKPEAVAGFSLVADAVHASGVPAFVQLLHGGRQMNPGVGMNAAWAASPIACRETRSPVHPVTEEEIRDITTGFADSAANVARSGLDGVEVHAAHGYLLSGFMSPYSNHRTDKYGGDFASRMRVSLEVLEAIDKAISADTVLGIRVSADEQVPGGMSVEDVCAAIDYLRTRVRIDYVSVSLGNYTTHELIVPDHSFPPAFNTERAKKIRDELAPMPILIAGRIRNGAEARRVIEDRSADMVGIARGLIADPDWALAALAGDDSQRGRPCIYCNEDCRTNVGKSLPLACSVNPRVGSEDLRPTSIEITDRPRTMTVVGAGPAGITAALRASELGMQVTLYEAGSEVGGQLLAAAGDPGRSELASYLQSMSDSIKNSDVKLHLNTKIDEPASLGQCDELVLALGAVQRVPAWATQATQPVIPISGSWVALTSDAAVDGQHVVVVDDGEDGWGLSSIVENLRFRGATVTVVTEGPFAGYRLPPLSIRPFVGRLESAAVARHVFSTIKAVDGKSVHLASTATWLPTNTIEADQVVFSGNTEPSSYIDGWGAAGARVSLIGDYHAHVGLGPANRDAIDTVDRLVVVPWDVVNG